MSVLAPAVWLNSYRQGLRDALARAAADGYSAIHADVGLPDLSPSELSQSGRRHLRRHLEHLGLELRGLAAEFPGLGLADSRSADQRVRRLRETLALCADLGVRRASTTIAGYADDAARDVAAEMTDAVADMADRYGVELDISTRARDLTPAARRLHAIGSPQLGLTLDSGAVESAATELSTLGATIHEVFLRDVRRTADAAEEAPFGQGDVEFADMLHLITQMERQPEMIVRRNAGGAAVDALRQGRDYIESLWNRIRAD